MNRQEFMRRLEQLLEGIPEEEKREAIACYTSYFEDAGEENEEKIIRELESPEKVAQPSGQISQDAIIVRQHLPVISRIIGGLFGIAVGCVIGGIAVAGVAITILVTGVISLGFISMAAGLLMLAIGLCAAGLLVLVCGKFLPWFAKGIAKLWQSLFKKKGGAAP